MPCLEESQAVGQEDHHEEDLRGACEHRKQCRNEGAEKAVEETCSWTAWRLQAHAVVSHLILSPLDPHSPSGKNRNLMKGLESVECWAPKKVPEITQISPVGKKQGNKQKESAYLVSRCASRCA